MPLKICFRADASLQIGTGHVMRCLTLADALVAQGNSCQFISRSHPGDLIEFLRSRGYLVHVLPESPVSAVRELEAGQFSDDQPVAHSHWLGVTQKTDAEACAAILAELRPDWLVVDHYALDARWERSLKPYYRKLLVIDDLADRMHACDLLLDQTYGRQLEDYRARVPDDCELLCGSQYALLRPEFAALRPYSLQRRADPRLCQLLITMGGVDKDNATGQVLEALRACSLPAGCKITVVMGQKAPWLAEVEQLAKDMPWPTRVLVGVSDMAQLMADSDLAIGAAGATAWERCCLGLPMVMVQQADNQRKVAQGLEQAGAAQVIESAEKIGGHLLSLMRRLVESPELLKRMGEAAADIVDGHGANTVTRHLEL